MNKYQSLEKIQSLNTSTKTEAIKVEYNGIEFESINSACKLLGVGRTAINNYINAGCTFEEAVDKYFNYIKSKEETKNRKLKEQEEKEQRVLNRRICIDGVYYKDIKYACKQLDTAGAWLYRTCST